MRQTKDMCEAEGTQVGQIGYFGGGQVGDGVIGRTDRDHRQHRQERALHKLSTKDKSDSGFHLLFQGPYANVKALGWS